MAGRLEGKVAVITGAGNGMARQVALRFAAEGAAILGCEINAETAAETVELVREAGGTMESLYPLDLTIEEDAHRLAEYAAERFGGIDILYNNAVSLRLGSVENIRLEDWRFTIENTLTNQFLTTKHAIPHLRARGGGSIIFVGSVTGTNTGAGYSGNFGFAVAYAAAKAGVLRMTTVLANELGEHNIRVNALSPGYVGTPQTMPMYGELGSEPRRIVETGALIRRLGEGEDVANAALFLASEESAWVTGVNLMVDGGFVASGGFGPAREEDKAVIDPLLAELSDPDDQWTSSARGRRAR